MKLTKERAISKSIELWEWLAETGEEDKGDWPEWNELGHMEYDCPLCEYQKQKGTRAGIMVCAVCPYYERFGRCCDTSGTTIFDHWIGGIRVKTRQKYAALFLEQLKELKK